MWIAYALLAAVFAALTSILAKVGLQGVSSNLATALRTVIVLVMAWLVVLVAGEQKGISTLTSRNLLFIAASGLATGLSWLFYFRALQIGDVSKVAPIDKSSIVLTLLLAFFFLKEPFTPKTIIGGALIAAGTLVIAIF